MSSEDGWHRFSLVTLGVNRVPVSCHRHTLCVELTHLEAKVWACCTQRDCNADGETDWQAGGFPLFTVESARLWLCGYIADLQYYSHTQCSMHISLFSALPLEYICLSFILHSPFIRCISVLFPLRDVPLPVLSSVTFYISLFVHFLLFNILSIILPP